MNLWLELGTHRLTWRRLRVLIAHLPRDSAFVQARGGEMVRWGDSEHLLANVYDAVKAGNYLLTRAHFKGKPQPPKPMPRPGDKAREAGHYKVRRPRSIAEMHKLLRRWEQRAPQTFKTEEVT